MKCLILALDALEFQFIEEWNLNKFKQTNYGTHDVSMLEEVYTLFCFSALLTGRDPREFGYTREFETKQHEYAYSSWLRYLYWIRKNLFFWIKSLGLRQKLINVGLFDLKKLNRNMDENMKNFTIIRKLENEGYRVHTDNVPSYDEKMEENIRGKTPNYIGKDLFIRETFINNIMEMVRKRWIKNLSLLNSYDLLFIYSPLPDIAHHLTHHKEEINLVRKIYEQLIDLPLLFELKNVAVLILSDHGYNHKFNENGKDIEGHHSNHGFWSLNIDTDNKPKTVFDFYDLIYELIHLEN